MPNGDSMLNKQTVAIGVVVGVLIALFTLINNVPFVGKGEFADFKGTMLNQFADVKQLITIEQSDVRSVRNDLESLKMDVVKLDARITALQSRLDAEDMGAGPPQEPAKRKLRQ